MDSARRFARSLVCLSLSLVVLADLFIDIHLSTIIDGLLVSVTQYVDANLLHHLYCRICDSEYLAHSLPTFLFRGKTTNRLQHADTDERVLFSGLGSSI